MNKITKAMPMPAWPLILALFTGLLAGGCGSSGQRAQQGAQHPAVGQPLVFLDLEPLTGEGTAITKESLLGRVTLINFWATWCPPCKVEFPHLAAMTKKLSGESKFQFLSVNTDDEEPAEARALATKFLLEQGASHPTWIDPTRGTWSALAQHFGASGIPLTVVIDSQGIVRGMWNGYMRGDEVAMEALVRELLSSQ
jgi:cytochrome c biogenesis protein CcmG, thiol:disulfide interchange protein DsbE